MSRKHKHSNKTNIVESKALLLDLREKINNIITTERKKKSKKTKSTVQEFKVYPLELLEEEIL